MSKTIKSTYKRYKMKDYSEQEIKKRLHNVVSIKSTSKNIISMKNKTELMSREESNEMTNYSRLHTLAK